MVKWLRGRKEWGRERREKNKGEGMEQMKQHRAAQRFDSRKQFDSNVEAIWKRRQRVKDKP